MSHTTILGNWYSPWTENAALPHRHEQNGDFEDSIISRDY